MCFYSTTAPPAGTGVALGCGPLDFQLFNSSGHFRATQTLTFDSVWFPIQ